MHYAITPTQIQAVAEQIGREFNPQQIILFGSHAYGTPHADSDVDLLVVLAFEGKTFHKAAEIAARIRPPFPTDILVRAPDELARRIHLGDYFLREITENGRVLYQSNERIG